MERFVKTVNRFVNGCLIFLTFVIVFTTGTQIFLRVLFDMPLSWTEEVACYSFIWWVFFGSIIALREGRHLGIDALMNVLPKKVLRYWWVAIYLSILVYLAVMFWQGARLIRLQMVHTTPITGVPLGWIIAIIPICAVLMGFYTVILMVKGLREKEKTAEKDEAAVSE